LEFDILVRAQALASAGAERLFGDLHEQVSWHGDRLRIANALDFRGPLDGRGLVLVPSAFSWPRVLVMCPPYQPSLSYPPRGVAPALGTPPPAPPGSPRRPHRPPPPRAAHRARDTSLNDRSGASS